MLLRGRFLRRSRDHIVEWESALLQPQPRLFHFTDPLGACPICHGTGIEPKQNRVCGTCHGSRFSEQALSVRLGGRTIADLCAMSLAAVAELVNTLSVPEPLLQNELRKRLETLTSVELGYLTLNRAAATLSTGDFRYASNCRRSHFMARWCPIPT